MTKKKIRVLIVEDEKTLNQAYQIILKKEGYEVFTAKDGREALVEAEKNKPNLILLDLRMPEMDGNTFLREYDLSKHEDVKVIVFSNFDTQNEIDEAYGLGIERYILKALASPKELVKLIEDTLS